jgi:hypothetical protein
MPQKIFILNMPNDCEGRSSHDVGYFTSAKLAQEVGSLGFGNQSMGPNSGLIREVTLFASMAEFQNHNADALRAKALAKLTPDEKKLLGLA